MTEKLNVIYIGDKPEKVDNVSGSGAVWRGHGDVQAVNPESWAKLSKHPNVWVLAGDQQAVAVLTPGIIESTDIQSRHDLADEIRHAVEKATRKVKVTAKVAPPAAPDQAED